jgi:hypothetical protein
MIQYVMLQSDAILVLGLRRLTGECSRDLQVGRLQILLSAVGSSIADQWGTPLGLLLSNTHALLPVHGAAHPLDPECDFGLAIVTDQAAPGIAKLDCIPIIVCMIFCN